ncbi:MAG: prolyl oligopeptidase family serine peptidase [Tepidisphaeraceae bacterium]
MIDQMRRMMRLALAACLLVLTTGVGCDRQPAPLNTTASAQAKNAYEPVAPIDAASIPARPEFVSVAPDVERGEVSLRSTTGKPMKLWVYLPTATRPRLDRSLPAVLIAPAGSNCISGMRLSEGEENEHVPWVKAGFAVIAYELDGPLEGRNLADGVRAFIAARGGLANAAAALDYATARLPEVDPAKVVAVGHSSAATVALLVARVDPRVRAVVAFAPRADVAQPINEQMMKSLENVIPGSNQVIHDISPVNFIDDLAKPTMLFVAQDDENINPAAVTKLAEQLRAKGRSPQLIVVPSGGHYEPMIAQGIATAIEWTKRELTAR